MGVGVHVLTSTKPCVRTDMKQKKKEKKDYFVASLFEILNNKQHQLATIENL